MHPNILGLAGWTTGVAWLLLPDRAVPVRFLGALWGSLLILATDARTAAGAGLVAAAVLVAILTSGALRPKARLARAAGVGAVALFLTAAGFVATSAFFVRERAAGTGVLTGREAIWQIAVEEFRAAPTGQKLLGTSEGGAGARIDWEGHSSPSGAGFTAHNAFIGILRRSGLAGLALALAGVGLASRALVQSFRSRRPAAAMLAAGLTTVVVEDWVFGGSLFVWLALTGALLERDALEPDTPTRCTYFRVR